jgi:CheY-like chemotaxis protein
MMPELNGFDVAAVLKSDPATMDIPIVILSILQDRERGFRVGVDRYLTKPIDTDLLFREVGSLLEQRTSRRRVLVVDDDRSTVESLSAVLAARGYSVSGSNGADLHERAMAMQPDIIVLNSITSARSSAVQMLRFEKGMENVLFLVYE